MLYRLCGRRIESAEASEVRATIDIHFINHGLEVFVQQTARFFMAKRTLHQVSIGVNIDHSISGGHTANSSLVVTMVDNDGEIMR